MNIVRRPVPPESSLPRALHPALRRVYAARQVAAAGELDYSLERLLPFDTLKNIGAAAELLSDAIRQRKRMLIVADYDADGATACAVAVRGLAALGAAPVDFLAPDRVKHGYGLSVDVARLALRRKPALLVTVDNGISSLAGVDCMRQAGVETLITDHHLPGKSLPAASVIVNPNQPGDAFPSKCLAGVGVMFYTLLATRAALRDSGWFAAQGAEPPKLAEFLDLVALGTVADVVQLDYNNRILVEQGLRRIRAGCACPGIQALTAVAGGKPEQLSATDLGYMLAPRLNAAGRLEDMRLGIECLLAADSERAVALAQHLDEINRKRRMLQADMQQQAEAELGDMSLPSAELPLGICLYDPGWHQGIVGVLAGRIRERANRPTIVFAPGGAGQLKGSGRSLAGIHLRDVLESLATRHPELIERFGGHAMAAGLSIRETEYPRFRDLFDSEIQRLTAGRPPDCELLTDGELRPEEFNLELALTLTQAGPWGQGFPEPLFDGAFIVKSAHTVGGKHLKLKLLLSDSSQTIDAISFNTPGDPEELAGARLRLVYRLKVDDFHAEPAPQLVITHLQPDA